VIKHSQTSPPLSHPPYRHTVEQHGYRGGGVSIGGGERRIAINIAVSIKDKPEKK